MRANSRQLSSTDEGATPETSDCLYKISYQHSHPRLSRDLLSLCFPCPLNSPNTFTNYWTLSDVGSDVVDWLYSHVEGFQDRRDARKYACNLLKVITLHYVFVVVYWSHKVKNFHFN